MSSSKKIESKMPIRSFIAKKILKDILTSLLLFNQVLNPTILFPNILELFFPRYCCFG